jgi:large subunit ribosomal protein L7Ae
MTGLEVYVMAKGYVTYQVSKELSSQIAELLQVVSETGKIRRGTNESTKIIERGQAKLVVIAEDVEPEEVVMHIPMLCDERKIPYTFLPSKLELGRAAGIEVPCACVAVLNEGDGSDLLRQVVSGIESAKNVKKS